ncbi:MAG: hypothetical protein WAU68_16840 [Vitreimonas sp.]
MQGPIAQALALTCVGNSFLRGRDVSGFWPDASVFRFSKTCDFRWVEGERDQLIAADPMAWFETLRAEGCKGLRLHHAPRARGPKQTIPAPDRMLVGFVGGGPAWPIEQVGGGSPVLWQGFDRVGNPRDADGKIWLNTYLHQGETVPQNLRALSMLEITSSLAPVLAEIATLAAKLEEERFAKRFRSARVVLEASEPAGPSSDFVHYAPLDAMQLKLLNTVETTWVFGGMGSWNDVGAPEELKADYERLSEALFALCCDAICAIANATYAT